MSQSTATARFRKPPRPGAVRRRQRAVAVFVLLIGCFSAAGLALTAFQDNLLFFYSPADVAERGIATGQRFRLGGLVEDGSIDRNTADALAIRFNVVDGAGRLTVAYTGIVPDLFREGQGVIAEGALGPGGVFQAETILARHDETYMPKQVADALKERGLLRPTVE
jgi:cytochrome c-type biogenesis protein CcmE